MPSRAFEFRRARHRAFAAGPAAAHGHAGYPDRRELPHHEHFLEPARHHHRASGLPYMASAASASSCCARPSRPYPRSWTTRPASRARMLAPADPLEGLRAAGQRRSTSPTAWSRVSYHWNNFLWPLVITNSVETRPLTVGLAIFGAPESGVDWSVVTRRDASVRRTVAGRVPLVPSASSCSPSCMRGSSRLRRFRQP